jgi:hypothetical protein
VTINADHNPCGTNVIAIDTSALTISGGWTAGSMVCADCGEFNVFSNLQAEHCSPCY